MSSITELQEGLAQIQTAQFVTTMLRDISATRLQSIRAAFEANEAYYSELHDLMGMVKAYAKREGIVMPIAAQKRVYIAVTSNRRFYGALNRSVMKQYLTARSEDPEAAGYVIGQTGHSFLERIEAVDDGTRKLFHGDVPAPQEAAEVIKEVLDYQEVVVIHPQFINSFQQKPTLTDISHVPPAEDDAEPFLEYICEPELPELITFFTTQIRLVLLERVFLSTQVALTGARLMKMQRARERATELVGEEEQRIHKEVRTIQSMHLLEAFTGYTSERSI